MGRKPITYAGVAILAFCAGMSVSFFTLPLWVTFAINAAKGGNRTDWLGFAGSVGTAFVAAVAIFFAWKGIMRQSRLSLVSREEDWIAARLPGMREASSFCYQILIAKQTRQPSQFLKRRFEEEFKFSPYDDERRVLPHIERMLPRTADEMRKDIAAFVGNLNVFANSWDVVQQNSDIPREWFKKEEMRFNDELKRLDQFAEELTRRIKAYEARLPKLRANIEEFFDR
jgi:hypothetical protein